MQRFTGVLGLLTMLTLAWIFSTNRRAIRMKTVGWGLGLQIVFAFLVIDWAYGRHLFEEAGKGVNWLLGFAAYGANFVFGAIGVNKPPWGLVFAFQVLPTIIFIAAVFALLYYLRIMQLIIWVAAWIMTRFMGVSGAESLNVAASIFMGQTEAPLTIRPYLPEVTRSELMTIMTSGMAHVSGGIMAAYIAFGIDAQHLLEAVVMTAPGTLLISKMLVPETESPVTSGKVKMAEMERDPNALGAISRGTTDGLNLAINVGAMLISFIALIYLLDGCFGFLHTHMAWFPGSLEQVLGWIFWPVAWVIGIPRGDCSTIANLLGLRMVTNELIAFQRLGPMAGMLNPRSFTIATFALCGFANFSSIGIQIGGIGALAPNKKSELAKLGLRAMLAGTMANLMSASIVGIMLR
jgi:concentrative nucleoside transporter, CNT family